MRKLICVSALAASACLILAACGSSTPTGTSANSGASSTPKLTGAPIRLGMINTETGPGAEPWYEPAFEVSVSAINASGGIDGHPVIGNFCDDQFSPQQAAVCAQKLLVQDKDVMLIANDGQTDAGVLPSLKTAKTIIWGGEAASSEDLMDPALVKAFYPSYAEYAILPQIVGSGHNVAVFSSNNAPALIAAKSTVASFKAAGNKASVIQVPIGSTSFGTPCEQAKAANANTAIVLFGAADIPPMMQACAQLGVKLTWVIGGTTITAQVAQTASQLGIKTIVATGFTQKAHDQFTAAVTKYGPSVPSALDDSGVSVWVAMQLLGPALNASGAIDKSTAAIDVAKLSSWLDTQTAFSTDGYTKPLNMSPSYQPMGADYSSIKNTCVYEALVKGQSLSLVSSTPICLK